MATMVRVFPGQNRDDLFMRFRSLLAIFSCLILHAESIGGEVEKAGESIAALVNRQLGRDDREKLDEYLTGNRGIAPRSEEAERLGLPEDPDDATPAGLPTSYRDHTMIVYGSGTSDGDRDNHDDLPIIVAGVKATGLRGDTTQKFSESTRMADLHLERLHRVVVERQSFGDSNGRLEMA